MRYFCYSLALSVLVILASVVRLAAQAVSPPAGEMPPSDSLAVGASQYDAFEGIRIDSIIVEPLNVFNTFEEGYDNFLFRTANRIEADPAHPDFIHTVWGVGYKFADA